MESVTEDTECILEQMNISHLFKVGQKNAGHLGQSENLVGKHFKTLTKKQIHGLIDLYWWDFLAFEYDYQSFLNLGMDV